MRFATVGVAGLAALLSGALPGSPAKRCEPGASAPEVHVDTFRRVASLEGLAWRDSDGVWTLPTEPIVPRPLPFEELSTKQVLQLLDRYPKLLGTASVGKANRGRLLNGVHLPQSDRWTLQSEEHAWGTPALVNCLERAVEAVHARFPNTPPLDIGDLSREEGGYLRGHRSHQSGLDADIGFYYLNDEPWYTKANRRNLDVERTWVLVRTLATDCDAEYLFVDLRIQALLREHAEKIGEAPEWLDELFSKGRNKPGIIRHTWGHQTHIHYRVFDDRAQLVGERVLQAELWARMRRPSAWSR